MANPWIALEPGADPAERAGAIRRAHETFTAAGSLGVGRPVRGVVAASWQRSALARVSPDSTAAVELLDSDLAAHRAVHPLARVMPLFRELMGTFALDGEHLLAVCDAQGRLLWVEGHRAARRRAETMNFVPGARWSETAVGTNAPGTAVTVDRPVQVFAAEHFSRPVQQWTCAAAPVHDPHTGRLLGAVDITGGHRLAHPHSLAFVQAVARAAESQLALLGPLPSPGEESGARIELRALGRDEADLVLSGRELRLSRRHSEIMALLASHPEGLSGDELLLALYEDEFTTPVTVRAELSRLRRILGPDLLRSRPYRLTVDVAADFDTVLRRLASGATPGALDAYSGPLLPGSQAPEVARLRSRVADQLRAALISHRDPDLLAAWTRTPWGAGDLEVWAALVAALPAGSLCRSLAEARLREVDAEQRW
ncbi:GAF domain-containing protein [Streptomyces sp. TP-A0874]|uniref:GAF domain-containing protein n=1 Tax=Streptomyces sp. TP-A0874 TaxID=549819 RepID=UPI00085330CB|nr:helix-turn-helix domain-containing protein [Streptomyces sp. TP-A0874]